MELCPPNLSEVTITVYYQHKNILKSSEIESLHILKVNLVYDNDHFKSVEKRWPLQ